MNYETIILEKEEGIATITLNRPEKLNAMNLQMIRELGEALEETDKDEEVRVVVITGAGRGFSSGADVGSFAEQVKGREQGEPTIGIVMPTSSPQPLPEVMGRMRKPVIYQPPMTIIQR